MFNWRLLHFSEVSNEEGEEKGLECKIFRAEIISAIVLTKTA